MNAGFLENLFVSVYDNGVVLMSKGEKFYIRDNHFLTFPGEEIPPLVSGELAFLVPPQPRPSPEEAEHWMQEWLREQFGLDGDDA
jgi:hypothetical protein